MLETIPKRAVNILHNWVENHKNILRSMFPNDGLKKLNKKSSVFYGPFVDEYGDLRIKHFQEDYIKLVIEWNTNDPFTLNLKIYGPYEDFFRLEYDLSIGFDCMIIQGPSISTLYYTINNQGNFVKQY